MNVTVTFAVRGECNTVLPHKSRRLCAHRIRECRVRFRVQHEQRINGCVVGQRDLDECDTEGSQLLQRRGIVGIRTRGLLRVAERGLQVTDSQFADVQGRVPIERYVLDGEIAIVGALNGVQHHRAQPSGRPMDFSAGTTGSGGTSVVLPPLCPLIAPEGIAV